MRCGRAVVSWISTVLAGWMAEFGRVTVEELVAEIESWLPGCMHRRWRAAARCAEAQRHWAAGEAMMRQALARRG